MTSAEKQHISIGAIVNEGSSTLLEWIAYHRVIGVEYFWIADNGCATAAQQLLLDLDRLGIIKHIPFPSQPGAPPQLPAYKKILDYARDFKGVVAFIDADEFIVPGNDCLGPYINRIFSDKSVSALAMNWATFGSNGALFADDGLVIERFTRRARQEFNVNHIFKSIVRPENVTEFINPHFALLSRGRYVNSAGLDLARHPKNKQGGSAEVCWEGVRLNHYAVKSAEEFLLGKHSRGSAATPSKLKHKKYFITHDRNNEECLLAARFAPLVNAEISRLTQRRDQAQPDHGQKQSAKKPPPAPADARHTQQENLVLHRMFEDLSVFIERLFSSAQYRFGSTTGALVRTLLGRREKRSVPEKCIRETLERYARLKRNS